MSAHGHGPATPPSGGAAGHEAGSFFSGLGSLKTFSLEIASAFIGGYILEFVKQFGQKGGAKHGEVAAKVFEEHRDEMFGWVHHELAAIDPVAHANFNRRWRLRELRRPKPYAVDPGIDPNYTPGDEIKFVTVFTGLYKNLGEKKEFTTRLETFRYYFNLDDQEFDIEMEQLVHDVMKQYGEKFWLFLKLAYGHATEIWQMLSAGPFTNFEAWTATLPFVQSMQLNNLGANARAKVQNNLAGLIFGGVVALLLLILIWS